MRAVAGSFRDPSGFLFEHDGSLFRQVNESYRTHFDHLVSSGLYQLLVDRGLLIPHQVVAPPTPQSPARYKVIRPEVVPFVSYPYEWSFHQLQAAARTTLEIAKLAFEHDMVLKDASAYNVQFIGSQPIFIDTLSFEIYQEGTPWVGYRQFCQHFLAPLALMSHRDPRLNALQQVYIDGVPLALAVSLLPRRALLRWGLFTHLYLHARAQRRYAHDETRTPGMRPHISRLGFRGLLASLEGAVRRLQLHTTRTEWSDYYAHTNYEDAAMEHKQTVVRELLARAGGLGRVVDIGANTGQFSTIASERASYTLAVDIDPLAVDQHFQRLQAAGAKSVLPLRIDLSAPSPAIGWDNAERPAFLDRLGAETVLALALVHHLAIANNTPLARIAAWLGRFAEHLIIEFVPKSDSQVQRLLRTREDVFPEYDAEHFETAFRRCFEIVESRRIRGTERDLYLMRRIRADSRAR